MHVSVWGSSGQCLLSKSIFELLVIFLSRVARWVREVLNYSIELNVTPKVRNCIWVRALNVLNLKYERLAHNSAKVVPLQVFGKLSMFPLCSHCTVESNEESRRKP